MASQKWIESDSLESFIQQSYSQFDFFQLVRVLDNLYQADNIAGLFHVKTSEYLQLHCQWSLYYKPNTVTGFTEISDGKYRLETNVIGLIGAAGVLPPYDTAHLMKMGFHSALHDLLMIFNHRLTRHYYLAWRKYRLYLDKNEPLASNTLTRLLDHFIGIIPFRAMANPLPVFLHDALLYFSGFNARSVKTQEGLERILQHTFAVLVTIEPFKGTWVSLTTDNLSMFPSQKKPQGQFNALTRNCVIGQRAWHSQNRFCITLTVKNNEEYTRLLGTRDVLEQLKQLTRLYLGNTYQYFIKIILLPDVNICCQLSKTNTPVLAWSCWLNTQAPMQKMFIVN